MFKLPIKKVKHYHFKGNTHLEDKIYLVEHPDRFDLWLGTHLISFGGRITDGVSEMHVDGDRLVVEYVSGALDYLVLPETIPIPTFDRTTNTITFGNILSVDFTPFITPIAEDENDVDGVPSVQMFLDIVGKFVEEMSLRTPPWLEDDDNG